MKSTSIGFLAASFVTLASLTAAAPARAECGVSQNRPICAGIVTRLYVDGDFIYLDIDGDEALVASKCAPVAGRYMRIPVSDPGAGHYFSLALAAKLSGREIYVRGIAASADGKCEVDYITMD